MNQSIESGFHLAHLLRFLLAPTIIVVTAAIGDGQQTPSRSETSTPFAVSMQTPASSPSQSPAQQPSTSAIRLTRDEAVRLALAQTSAYQQAKLAELIASEDVKQARAAFLPRFTIPSTVIYNSPTLGPVPAGTASADRFSFISANAVTEYQSLVGASGEIDLAGRLRATLRRGLALLDAARAGTEVAHRALIAGVDDAYFGLALSIAKRRSAELNLAAAEEFGRVTDLMLNAGEVAQVDVTRARLQIASRRDDLEQARAAEAVAAGGLRVLVGYDFATPIEILDLTGAVPDTKELDRFVEAEVAKRPELIQFDAERRAAEQEVKAARAERLPQLTYSINGGFDTSSLKPDPLHDHTGALATVNLTIPLWDWGASRSREQQARLRVQSVESERSLALRNFTQQFYGARAQALAAATRYQFLVTSVVDAERNVQASIARYRSGEATIIEVTDAQSTLAAQRTALYQALFDFQSARARLMQATGK